MNTMNLNAETVISVYKEELSILMNEVIMLKAILKQVEMEKEQQQTEPETKE